MTTPVVVDLEATCADDGSLPPAEMEIIEIGAVALTADGRHELDRFSSLVRPRRHPRLTRFCTALTTIAQHEVDAADPFPVVLARFTAWLARFERPLFVSWGEYDRRQLQQDCRDHGVRYPFDARHLNLRRGYAERFAIRPLPSLDAALRHAGLAFAGTPHRGLDDARNIARLLPASGFVPADEASPQDRHGPGP